MERIDHLENTVTNLKRCLKEVADERQLRDECTGEAQNLKDREILSSWARKLYELRKCAWEIS